MDTSAPFSLDPRLAADTCLLGESELSLLLLMNERRYPWLILVPRRAEAVELFELEAVDRCRLLEESCLVSRVLRELFQADKINVAALGNVVRQLHVHQVARYVGDPAWPAPVWGHSPRTPYTDSELAARSAQLGASDLALLFSLRAQGASPG